MKSKIIISIASLLGLAALSGPVQASDLFVPASGSAFTAYGPWSAISVAHFNGIAYNQDSVNPVAVEATIGHAGGGARTVKVSILGNGGSTTCTVFAYPDSGNSGVSYASSNSMATDAGYVLPLSIQTNPPAGSYVYSVVCVMPPIKNGLMTGIVGVTN